MHPGKTTLVSAPRPPSFPGCRVLPNLGKPCGAALPACLLAVVGGSSLLRAGGVLAQASAEPSWDDSCMGGELVPSCPESPCSVSTSDHFWNESGHN